MAAELAPAASGSVALDAQLRFQRIANDGKAFVLDLSIQAESGFTILFGPSGSGKSTLLDCLAGLQRPLAGKIVLAGRILQDSTQRIFLSPQSRRIAYLFQSPSLFPNMTVDENIAFGLQRMPPQLQKSVVGGLLEMFRISHLVGRRPAEISGGETQRVALARALAPNPGAVLLDEPLSGLDAELKSSILDDLRIWNAAHRVPILYVTHQRDEVDALGEKVIAMDAGRVVGSGVPHAVLDQPRTRRLAQAAGFENHLRAVVTELREPDGVMRARLGDSTAELEVPLGYAAVGDTVRIAIRAGDILLASQRPVGLSARNILEGTVVSLEVRGATVVCGVSAGERFVVHVTSGALRALAIQLGQTVWLVIKTHSCRLVAE